MSKEIAAKLNLSVRTVEKHRANIMEKVGVREVASLTRWSARRAQPGDCPAVSPGTTIGKTLAMATERLDLIKQRTSLGVEP